MKSSKYRTKLATITLVLMLTLSAGIVAVSAQATGKTYPFIDAIPMTTGVDQGVLLNTGALNFLNTASDGWNVTIQITAPDNSVTVLGPFKTFSTGTWGEYFIPDQIGTYRIKTIFPQQDYSGVTYLASESEEIELVVQEDPVPEYPGQDIPREYWYRPIDSQLREWWSVAGSWDYRPENLFAPFNDAPTTSHTLWQIPIGDTQGGLIGGNLWVHAMDDGDAYEGKLSGSIIMNGIFFYNKQPGFFGGGIKVQTVVAIDIHTGQIIWEKQFPYGDGRFDYGQTMYWDSINNRGAHSYLWFTSGSTWYAVEPLTGEPRYNMTNVPGGTVYRGVNGELFIYNIVNYGTPTEPNYRLLRWSSFRTVQGEPGASFLSESWAPAVANAQYDASERGYDMNVSVNGLSAGETLPGSISKVFVDDKVIGTRVSQAGGIDMWAVSLTTGHEGALLYNKHWNAPAEWVEGNLTTGGIGQAGWCSWSQAEQMGVFFTKENLVHYAFDTETGNFMYETEPQHFIDAWSDTVSERFGPDRIIVNGKFISASVSGIVYCYDAQTGIREWTYEADDPFGESYIGNNWWIIPLFATEDMVYFGSLEHSALDPKPRGAPFFALDMEGNVVFRIDGMYRQTRWGGRAIMGDSIIVTQDTYDQQIYGIGKGPSETTVSAPASGVAVGSPIMITGSVMDTSPGTTQDNIITRFPNGVAAVSDASMNDYAIRLQAILETNGRNGRYSIPISHSAKRPRSIPRRNHDRQ
jgi:outer membrane protein assembly factor BamB